MTLLPRSAWIILVASLPVVTALLGCGGGQKYKPYEPVTSGGKGSDRHVVVSSPHRYVDVRWRSGDRTGVGRLLSRSRPDSKHVRRFKFALRGVPNAEVAVGIIGTLPFEAHAEARAPAGQRLIRAAVGPQSGSCGPQRPSSCAALPKRPSAAGTAHVAADGDDSATGEESAPFRTIARALSQPDVETVMVRPGTYPAFLDDKQRERPVTVRGAGPTRPVLEGAALTGSNLRFEDVAFTGSVVLGSDQKPAKDILIANSELSERNGASCIGVRPGTSGIEIRGSWIHDCHNGIGGPFSGKDDGPETSGVRIIGNLMERFVGDAVQFTDWQDVVIRHNLIREMHAGKADDHNDGVQIVGGSSRIAITANEMSSSDNQLILISDALGGPNEDIRIENNLLHAAGSWAINNFGAARVRVVNNTAWGNAAGGLIIGAAPGGDRRPERDTIVANNILDQFVSQDGAAARVQTGNVFGRSGTGVRRGEIEVAKAPGFVSRAGRDFTPVRRSAARDRASLRYLPADDLLGVPRRRERTAGALR